MAMFKAFKPSGMEKIARAMGYSGNMQGFQDYLAQDPMRQQQMQGYQQKAMQMAKGGVVKMQTGGIMQAPGSVRQTALARGNPDEGFVNPNRQPAQITTMMAGEEGGPMPDFPDKGGILGTPKTAAIGEDEPTPSRPIAKTMAIGEDEPGGIGGGVSKATLAIGEDQPTPLEINPNAYTRAVGEDGKVPPRFISATQAVGEQPGDVQPIARPNVTTQAMGEEDGNFTGNLVAASGQLLPTTEAMGEDGNFFRVPDNRLPVTIDGITYNSYTRAMGETSQPPPPPQQPITQLPQQAVPTYQPPQPTQEEITEFVDTDGNVYPSKDVVPDGVNVTEQKRTVTKQPTIADITAQQFAQPGLPQGGAIAPVGIQATPDQMIDPTTGQITGVTAVPTAMAKTYQAEAPQETDANLMQANTAANAVNTALNATTAAQGDVSPEAQVLAAQQTATSVGNLDAAQGNAILMENPTQREIQQGELISGAADAQKAAKFTEEIQAAQATPSDKATVQGQLEGLMTQFEGGETPVWAAGAMRAATAKMAARGLGASSVAGQAIIQAAMESAIPIAQADAAVTAQFEAQNLSNRQQRAMLAAQQRATFMGMEFDQAFQARVQNASRIADVANMNFTAEQQVALENSRIANSMNLANLSNSQALVMAEAAALSQMDAANLNNRQQAAVMNAQNFMQMDMANLTNRQQTDMFKAQQRIQSLFNDQAAVNAAAQFNATSQNQVDQFFANLSSQTSQFNATQANAQAQFNAGERNVLERFNAELNNQRDQFNATNQLAIAQSNVVWRREIATANTAAINRANELNATAVLDISKNAYDNLWNYYADTMEWAWKSAESELNRIADMAIANLNADERAKIAGEQNKTAAGNALGGLIGTLGSAWIGAKFCWVAREVYGVHNTDWFVFRTWMLNKSPKWLFNLYSKYGESFAEFISNKPKIKKFIKLAMDVVVKRHRKEHVRYVK